MSEGSEETASRERHWDELGHEEQVARMRLVVKNLVDKVEQLQSRVNDLEHHAHVGEWVYYRLRDSFRLGSRVGSPRSDSGGVYF